MAPRSRGGSRGGGGRGGSGRSIEVRNDDQEALLDAQAEMADTAAALKGVGETAGAPARAPPEAPAAV